MKKLFLIMSIVAVSVILCFSVSANAIEKRVEINNIVYEYINEPFSDSAKKVDFGEHYVVKNNTFTSSPETVTIIDEIDGIKVKGIAAGGVPQGVSRIYLSDNIEYIANYAFYDQENIKELVLPDNLNYLGESCFSGMTNLKRLIIPEGVTMIPGNMANYCTELESVIIEGDVTGIWYHAFRGCTKLKSINFPDSLHTIAQGAFERTALKKVELPLNVKVEPYAFQNCDSLEKVVINNGGTQETKKSTIYKAFYECDNIKSLYIKALPLDRFLAIPDGVDNIYFAGSPSAWNEIITDRQKNYFDENEIEIHFYYRHTHSFTRSGSPTCTKGGKFTYSCECGDSQTVTLAKDPDNHSYGSWKTVKKATYADFGTKQRVCKYCGNIDKAKIKKLTFSELQKLTATVEGNSVILSWDALEGATGYRVYIYDKEQNKNVKLASFKSKTTYTVSDLKVGESYVFRVKPYNKTSDGKVTWSKSFPIAVTVE